MIYDFTSALVTRELKKARELECIIEAGLATPEQHLEYHMLLMASIRRLLTQYDEADALEVLYDTTTYAQVYEAMGEEYANKVDNYARLKC